jgi:hypothetical protein
MRLGARLQRLARAKGIDRSCPACRPRHGWTTMVDVTVPAQCQRCRHRSLADRQTSRFV